MPEQTMVERCRDAILSKVPLGYGMTKHEAEEYARAAIAAMREPTDEMLGAVVRLTAQNFICGVGSGWSQMKAKLTARYQAMIDASLSESQTHST